MKKTISTFFVSVLALGAVSSLGGEVYAASLTGGGTCSNSNVAVTGYGVADQCAGYFDGNDSGNKGTLETMLNDNLFGDVGTWSLLGKSDEGGSGVTASNGSTSGTWSWVSQLTSPFAISVKAGNSYSAYFFENANALELSSGMFSTAGVKANRNSSPALSHLAVWVASGHTPPGDDGQVDIPEPSMLLGLGVLVGAIATIKRQKS